MNLRSLILLIHVSIHIADNKQNSDSLTVYRENEKSTLSHSVY